MKKIFTLLLVLTVFRAISQEQANIWYFGQNAGIDFNSGTAVAISGHMMTVSGGTAVMSDSTGSLLFYTDGMGVWNKAHQQMPNGFGLDGGFATQSALIVLDPGNPDLFYIFTVDAAGGSNGFKYSVVDMSLQADSGDVTLKNIAVFPIVTEKLAAVKHANGTDYWVMVHEWGANAFRAYQVSASGFNTTAIISNTGIVHDSSAIGNTYGQLKFSACGNRVAAAMNGLDTVDVFDFDAATGIVSNPVSLPFIDHVYGVEFSTDNSKLYVSSYNPSGTLLQYDLLAGTPAAIIASQVVISMTPDIYALQLAPDGKIYVVKSFSQFLGVINNPDSAGIACDYVDFGLDLDPLFMGVTASLGLPCFVQSYFIPPGGCIPNGVVDLSREASVVIAPNPSHGEIIIRNENFKLPFTLEVINTLGQVIKQEMVNEQSVKINLPEGFYFLSIKNNESEVTEKVIVY